MAVMPPQKLVGQTVRGASLFAFSAIARQTEKLSLLGSLRSCRRDNSTASAGRTKICIVDSLMVTETKRFVREHLRMWVGSSQGIPPAHRGARIAERTLRMAALAAARAGYLLWPIYPQTHKPRHLPTMSLVKRRSMEYTGSFPFKRYLADH